MTREVRASVEEMELKELKFINEDKRQTLTAEKELSYELNGNNVKYICNFDFKLSGLHITAKYSFVVSLNNIEEDEIADFISREEDEVLFPVYSKMCGLIMKITDEVTPFPFVGSPDMWITEENEEVEEDREDD